MRLGFWCLVAGIVLVGCADQPSVSGPSEAGPAPLLSAGPRGPVQRYIVVFRPGVTNVDALAHYMISTYGGQLHDRYRYALQGFSASLPAQALDGIRHNPLVELVEADAVVQHQAWSPIETTVPWGLDRIDQRSAQLDGAFVHGRSGSGVTVYLVDSGIRYSHEAFEGRASFGFDSYGGDGSDCNGHGTHVGGTIGGKNFGVAPGVRLVSVRVLSCSASGYVSSIIAGIDWIARTAQAPSVANLSIGAPAYDPLDRAVRGLVQAGVTVIVAASNYNADACNYSPARERSAITVGASNEYDLKASFSNWGPCVDIFAPGYGIVSAAHTSDDGTAAKNGTSMAAPHVTGAAALFLEGSPTASPDQVEAAIRMSATLGVVGSSNTEHNDMLFVGDSAASPPPPPPSLPPPPPPPSESVIDLSVAGVKEKGKSALQLTWRGAEGDQVRVLVNEVLHAIAPNTGGYRFQPEGKGRRGYVFQICESDGLLRCSSQVSVTF